MAGSKLTRRELRQEDEITSKLHSFWDTVVSRKNQLLMVVFVLLAVAVGVAIWRTRANSHNEEVQAQLGRVVSAFSEVGTPSAERFKKVIAEGEKTVADYGTRPEANLAKYYMAFGHEGLGETDKAIGLLEEVAGRTEGDMKGMARFAVAEIHARHGQPAKAIEILKDLLEKGGYTKSAVTLELARAHEGASQMDQAKVYYEKVITDYGTSPMRPEAESSLRRLGFPLPSTPAKNPS